MATKSVPATSGPPFPLGKPTRKPWREQSLAKIGEQRFLLNRLLLDPPEGIVIDEATVQMLEDHWGCAAAAAQRRSPLGAVVERVTGHLDAVDTDLLRLSSAPYVYGQLPGLLAQLKRQLPADDARVREIERLAAAPANTISKCDRDLIVAANHGATAEMRRQVTRLRSFRSLLYATAIALAVGAILLAVVGVRGPGRLPLCFSPNNSIVCPTSTTAIGKGDASQSVPAGQPSTAPPDRVDAAMRNSAGQWDITLVEGVGLLAAAVAAAASLRGIRGTSAPFSVPIAVAVLKLPTGALTAVLGLLLMRGGFVPGLGALDTAGQIIAWAILLGYSQQLLTQFVDKHAQAVLDNFGHKDPSSPGQTPASTAPTTP
jgi:hypothetical protein